MITAQRLLRNQEVSVSVPDDIDKERWIVDVGEEAVIAMMKQYAKEAIKEDRKNVAKHAIAFPAYENAAGTKSPPNLEAFVHQDSIINAPNIELL